MKDLIKKILREETSGLTDKQIKSGYSLMNMITKGYHWYYDTPERPFSFDKGSIWLINPETNEWMLELKNSGELWYYYKTRDTFSNYLNMEHSDFELFFKVWMKDVLKREVTKTFEWHNERPYPVEDVLRNGKQMK